MSTYFKTTNISPRSGFFYETHGEKVSARYYVDIVPRVRALMKKYNIPGTVEEVVAEYMCPRIPESSFLCTGNYERAAIYPREALANAMPYTSRRVVTFDVIEDRLRTCMECPMHTRDFCVTCTGHAGRMLAAFGRRRPSLPEDRGSGICRCAKAYELALASVEYPDDEPVWEGAPDTCWRKRK